jgi:hypothetical protein
MLGSGAVMFLSSERVTHENGAIDMISMTFIKCPQLASGLVARPGARRRVLV